MGKFVDITGNRYGELTVLGLAEVKLKNRPAWRCICDCGREKVVAGDSLKCGAVKCCGAHKTKFYSEALSRRSKIQNRKYPKETDSHSRLYTLWRAMKWRCLDPTHVAYDRYGGAGITICDDWMTYSKFREWAVSSGYQEHLTIDRKDNNRGYCPDNCRWATHKEQSKNKKSGYHLTAFGETKHLMDWISDPRCKASPGALRRRLKSGHSTEFAISASEHEIRHVVSVERERRRRAAS
jgi:hypothetical protein